MCDDPAASERDHHEAVLKHPLTGYLYFLTIQFSFSLMSLAKNEDRSGPRVVEIPKTIINLKQIEPGISRSVLAG